MPDLDLDKLYELAQAAIDAQVADDNSGSAYHVAVTIDKRRTTRRQLNFAADPTTILALIERCRRAETALREIEEYDPSIREVAHEAGSD